MVNIITQKTGSWVFLPYYCHWLCVCVLNFHSSTRNIVPKCNIPCPIPSTTSTTFLSLAFWVMTGLRLWILNVVVTEWVCLKIQFSEAVDESIIVMQHLVFIRPFFKSTGSMGSNKEAGICGATFVSFINPLKIDFLGEWVACYAFPFVFANKTLFLSSIQWLCKCMRTYYRSKIRPKTTWPRVFSLI